MSTPPLRTLIRPTLIGLCAGLPVPGLALATSAAMGSLTDLLISPAGWTVALVPALAAGAGWAFGCNQHRMAQEHAAWCDERRDLLARRRALAAEVAQLQAVGLSTLSDLEDAEAELQARIDVLESLDDALHDTLHAVDMGLHEIARAVDPPSAQRLRGLGQQIGELLELVQDAGTLTDKPGDVVDITPFSVLDALADAIDDASARIDGRDVTWEADEDVPAWVRGEAQRLQAVVQAAIGQAASTTVGPIHLQVQRVERGGARGLRISWGAPEDDLLSLGISARLADALGMPPVLGSQSHSATWWLQEPVRPEDTVVPTALPKGRVLLCASLPAERARLRRLLDRWGFEVEVTRSGEEALTLLDRVGADIVLLDLHEDSLPTLNRIRADREHGALPVLVLSPELDNLVFLPTRGAAPLTQPVRQDSLREDLELVMESHAPEIQVAQRSLGQRVLALEPNAVVAAAVVRASLPLQCEVHVAPSLRAARLKAEQGPWDVVLIDMELPDLDDAIAVLASLIPADVPRLGVLPRVTPADREHARARGLSDCALRPSTPVVLARLLDAVGHGHGPVEAVRR